MSKSPKCLSQSLTITDTRLAMKPNDNVNNVPMDRITGFRIASGFIMSILWGSSSIFSEHYGINHKQNQSK